MTRAPPEDPGALARAAAGPPKETRRTGWARAEVHIALDPSVAWLCMGGAAARNSRGR